jgi:hypothetical protein
MNETIQLPRNFRRLELSEKHESRGGLAPILIGLGIAAGAAIINDWDNFKNGLFGRPEVK